MAMMLASSGLLAQQTQGKVTYNRTIKLRMSFNGLPSGLEQQVPTSRTEKYELDFGNNQSLWKKAEQMQEDDQSFSEGGTQVRMVFAGSNDVLFCDLANNRRVDKRELFDKNFIVEDTLRKFKWKMTGETKTILNHNCMKAEAVRIEKRSNMMFNNGKMERTETDDTAKIVAWFATDIPVSAGPSEFQGQLPGLILELDVRNGDQVYIATEISDKTDLAEIKEPTGKKKYTVEEFRQEREKMLKEMNQNNGGGNRRVIRMN